MTQLQKSRSLAKRPIKNSKIESQFEWQTGEFERHQSIRYTLPIPFLLLCKLMDITPNQLITDFLDNLARGSWKREGRDRVKEILVDYFLEHGYGQNHYSPEEIRQIFREMDAVGLLFPTNANAELIDLYVEWREYHQKFWFNKWFNKNERKLKST